MFLSIIIPVYKVEPYLRECLDSIAASPLECWEAILIDDGSPDGCPQICDEYASKDCRFRVIHQENAGVAVARNAGLDIAQGQWCWFVDSDDVVDMQPVGDMMTWLQEHQEVDLVMFDLETFKENEEPKPETRNLKLACSHETVNRKPSTVNLNVTVGINKNDFLMKHICYHHQRLWYHRRGWGADTTINEGGVVVEKEKESIRFSRGIRLAEDLEFQYKYLTLCQHPVKVFAVLYYYRLRETSATGDVTYRKRAVEDLPIVLNNIAEWSQKNEVKPEPWFDYRIMKLLQNLLYSASLVQNLNTKNFQQTIWEIVAFYKILQFPFVNNKKIRLATWSVRAYFLFNNIYLKFKGIK